MQLSGPRTKLFIFVGIAFVLILVSLRIFVAANETNSPQAHATATAQSAQTATDVAGQAIATSYSNTALSTGATLTAVPFSTTTAVAPNSPDSTFRKLAFYDPLQDDQQGHGWSETGCTFSNGGYTVSADKADTTYLNFLTTCQASHTDFTDFAYQIDMTINQGDCGGITFRAHNDALDKDAFADFEVCRDHSYNLYVHKPKGSVTGLLENDRTSSSIHTNQGQTNRLAVIVQDQMFKLYVNGQFLTSVTDREKVTNHGSIGVSINESNKSATSVTFTNATVWTS